jgi:ankyrin repeat protein
LIYAISSEHWTVVEILIAAGAAYAKPDPAGWSALHSAIVKDPNQMGDIFRRLSFSSSLKKRLEEFPNRATEAILEEMLELGLSFNAETCIKYNCKSTMLEHLIMGEKPDTVMALIGFANEHSIDLFKSKDRSIYPIHLAAQEGHVDLVRRLLNLGFSVDSLTDNGKTPLCKSCELVSPGCHSEMVIFLLENGASVRYADKCKILCDLSNAFVQTYAFDQYVSNRIEYTAFEMLLHKGANPDLECNPADGTLLHNAVRTDDLRAVQILLDNKANPNLSNDRGTTPLHIAARGGIVSIVQMLLEHGALPNIKDEYDCTPLDFAKRRKHLSVIKQLTTVGATSGKCTDGLNG